MISLMSLRKLQEADVATITRFIDRIRRTKGRYDQEQQALLDLAENSLMEIVKACRSLHAPITKEAMITTAFNEKKLKKAKEALLAITEKIRDFKESAHTVLAILGKIN